jgi:hypothetical protein
MQDPLEHLYDLSPEEIQVLAKAYQKIGAAAIPQPPPELTFEQEMARADSFVRIYDRSLVQDEREPRPRVKQSAVIDPGLVDDVRDILALHGAGPASRQFAVAVRRTQSQLYQAGWWLGLILLIFVILSLLFGIAK